jgi:hypothetical protein
MDRLAALPSGRENQWAGQRALRPGGIIGFVAPDSRHVDTFSLNPEHKHETTPEIARRWLDEAEGYVILREGIPVPGWSFGVIAKGPD